MCKRWWPSSSLESRPTPTSCPLSLKMKRTWTTFDVRTTLSRSSSTLFKLITTIRLLVTEWKRQQKVKKSWTSIRRSKSSRNTKRLSVRGKRISTWHVTRWMGGPTRWSISSTFSWAVNSVICSTTMGATTQCLSHSSKSLTLFVINWEA